jgi:mRNA interferase HigB
VFPAAPWPARSLQGPGPASQWFHIASKADWANLNDGRASFPSADQVGQVLILNLGGNAYRMIVTVYYAGRTLYVKALLSHAEYDRKDWMKCN